MNCILMSILNLTDNSFLERSRMKDKSVEDVVSAVAGMIEAGAGIVDVGACSSAPGNEFISAEQEWERYSRVMPVLFREFPQMSFSFDTFRAEIVEKLLDCADRNPYNGEFIVNDIFAGNADPRMLPFVAEHGLRYIAMDSTADPYGFFSEFAPKAEALGLKDWILDPGFGFGKDVQQNWKVFEQLPAFHDFGRPVLAALSHKRMIYMPLGLTPATCTEQSVEAEARAVKLGADMVRTHDVALLKNKILSL